VYKNFDSYKLSYCFSGKRWEADWYCFVLGKRKSSKLFDFFKIVQNCPLLTSKIDIIIRVDSKLASATSYAIFAKSVNSLHTTLIIFFLTVYFHVSICSGNIQKEHDRAHPLYVQIKFLS